MKVCLQASPLCAVIASNRSLDCWNVWSVTLKAGDNLGLVWSTQKRQNQDTSGHWAPWQGLAAAACRDQPGTGSSAHPAGRSLAPSPWPWGHSCAGSWWGWCGRWSPRGRLLPAEEPWLCKGQGRWRDGEPTELGTPQPGPSVHGANWDCKTPLAVEGHVWLWAKLYRHHGAVTPTHPCETAACKHQHCQWQLRLEMDCTCFPWTQTRTTRKRKSNH